MQPSGDWLSFSSTRYCRRTQLYELEWSVTLDDQGTLTSAAPCGGPFAIAKAVMGGSGMVEVYSASGIEMLEITMPMESGNPAAMGWSSEEALVILTDKLHCLTYDLAGDGAVQHHIKLLQPGERESIPINQSSVPLALVRSCGCFCITEEKQLRGVVLQFRKKPQTIKVDLSSYFSHTPGCFEVMAPDLNLDEQLIVYVCPSTNDDEGAENMIVVKPLEDEIEDMQMDTAMLSTGVAALKLSYLGTRLAIFTNEAQLVVVNADLQEVQYRVNIGSATCPQFLHWCGPDNLVLTYSESQFDPQYGDSSQYSVLVPIKGGDPEEGGNPDADIHDKFEKLEWNLDGSGRCNILQEIDGVRVTTETACYFIESVPTCLVQLFGFQSQAKSAKLANAYFQYKKQDNVEGFNTIRALAKERGEGYIQCLDSIIQAAAHEWDEESQTRLLGIASFGQSLLRIKENQRDELKLHETSDYVVDTTKRLRVLNAVRGPECGMPLSFRQYQSFSGTIDHALSGNEAQILVNRLVNRKQFHLAYDVANFFHLKIEKILTYWATSKVQSSLPDSVIVKDIHSVLGQANVGYTDAAITAFEVGKQALAEQLLLAERRTRHQVLLFLEMNRNEIALQKAVDGDEVNLANLCFVKLLHNKTSDQQFANVLAGSEMAQRQFYNNFRMIPKWRKLTQEIVEDTRRQDLLAIELLKHLFNHPRLILYDSMGELVNEEDEDDDPAEREHEELDLDEHLRSYKVTVKEVTSGPRSIYDVAFDLALKKPVSVVTTRTLTQGVMEQASDFMGQSARWSNPAEPFNDARWLGLQADLLRMQIELAEETCDECFHNETVMETIRLCFIHGKKAKAEEIRAKFNVGEKKYWYVQLQAMCKAGDWDGVDKLGGGGAHKRKVKSPIGFLPFVTELAARERQEQAAFYVAKLTDICLVVEWYVKLDHFKEAIDAAYQADALDLLYVIKRKAKHPSTMDYLNAKIRSLE